MKSIQKDIDQVDKIQDKERKERESKALKTNQLQNNKN